MHAWCLASPVPTPLHHSHEFSILHTKQDFNFTRETEKRGSSQGTSQYPYGVFLYNITGNGFEHRQLV